MFEMLDELGGGGGWQRCRRVSAAEDMKVVVIELKNQGRRGLGVEAREIPN
jgi:hypothetical protein